MRTASGLSCRDTRSGSRSLIPGGSRSGLNHPCHHASTAPLASSSPTAQALTSRRPGPDPGER